MPTAEIHIYIYTLHLFPSIYLSIDSKKIMNSHQYLQFQSTATELILLFSRSIFVPHVSLALPGPGPSPGADCPPQGEPPQGLTPHSGPPTPTDTLLIYLGPNTPGQTILCLDILLVLPDLQHLQWVEASSPHTGFDTIH